jgi:hypothetical protein
LANPFTIQEEPMTQRLHAWLLGAGILLTGGAEADPRGDLMTAFEKSFAPGRQLRAEMLTESGGEQMRMTTEMVLPGRFRTTNDRGEFLITPDGAWMRPANGDWQAFELNPASMSAAYTPEGFQQMREAMRAVKALGVDPLDGKSTQRFGWHADTEYMGIRSSSDNIAWVEAGCGCIVKMRTTAVTNGQSGTTTITYHQVDGLKIDPPAGIR